jgi:hypothetical protein
MPEPLQQIDPHYYRLTRLLIVRAEIERLRRADCARERDAPKPLHEGRHIVRLTVPGWTGAAREQLHDRVR